MDTFKWLFDTFQSHAGVYYTSELISFFPKELGEISLLYESLLSLRTTDTQLSHYLFISDVFFSFSAVFQSTVFNLLPTMTNYLEKENGKLSHAAFSVQKLYSKYFTIPQKSAQWIKSRGIYFEESGIEEKYRI